MTRTFFLLSLFFAVDAMAYIPKAHTIAGRLVRTHGKGAYIIEQDVSFRTNGDPLVLREKWTIESGDVMRVSVSLPQGAKSAEPVRFETVYHGGKKTMTDPAGGPIKKTAAGDRNGFRRIQDHGGRLVFHLNIDI